MRERAVQGRGRGGAGGLVGRSWQYGAGARVLHGTGSGGVREGLIKKKLIILIEGSHTLTSTTDTDPSRLGGTGVLQCQVVSR